MPARRCSEAGRRAHMRPRWPVRAPGQYVRRMGTERTETARCQMRGPCWPGSHWLRDAAWETRGPRWPGSRGPHGTAWEARWPRWPGSRAGWIGAGARVARSECNRPAHLGVDLGRRRSPREGNDACNPPPVTTPTRGLVAPIVVGARLREVVVRHRRHRQPTLSYQEAAKASLTCLYSGGSSAGGALRPWATTAATRRGKRAQDRPMHPRDRPSIILLL